MAASNFAKGMVIGLQVGAESAKPPVLTELTVTENGVYDKPVILNGRAPITWDGKTDGKTFVSIESTFFVKMTDEIFLAEDFVGYAVTMNDGHVFDTEDHVYALPGAVVIGEMAVISVQDKDAFFAATEILNFPENGTYFASNTETGFYTASLTFPTSSTPADGWNKVTVNVPTGGLELNIAYGDTPPEDTSKYWIKSKTPQKFIFYKWNQVFSAADIVPSNTSMGTMPYRIHSCVTAVLGDVIYILGGTIFDNNQGRTVESTKVFTFDVNTKKVVELEAQLPTTVSTNNGGERIGEYVYFFKAEYGVFRYNLVTGQSETIETDYTPGNTCRSTHIGSKIYLIDASSSSNGLDEFDTETNIGRNVGYWSNSTSSARIIAVDDKIYMFGNTFVARYDLITNLSTVVRTGDSNNGNIMLAYLGGREIYCFGKYGTTAVKAFDIYSNQVNSVYLSMTLSGTTMSETGRNNMYLGLAVIGDTIYQFGGRDSGGSSSTDSSRYFADIVKYSIPKGKINSLTRGTMVFSVAERGYMAPIVATEDIQLNVPVDGCYMGDSDGVGRIVDAFVYSNNKKQWELARYRR